MSNLHPVFSSAIAGRANFMPEGQLPEVELFDIDALAAGHVGYFTIVGRPAIAALIALIDTPESDMHEAPPGRQLVIPALPGTDILARIELRSKPSDPCLTLIQGPRLSAGVTPQGRQGRAGIIQLHDSDLDALQVLAQQALKMEEDLRKVVGFANSRGGGRKTWLQQRMIQAYKDAFANESPAVAFDRAFEVGEGLLAQADAK